ncbi:hypothetical protein [Desulfofustis glycolicus]|uniref:hypothetical protein n=1 Tax=Desulfofustis glycolicus TaxID=51195 RepID=UPI00093391BD|nr:hypothetical protein [Desulfofustis glycolicus]MCB2218478.1 hypothetical protein [Desulfobulbaceae bacterium]
MNRWTELRHRASTGTQDAFEDRRRVGSEHAGRLSRQPSRQQDEGTFFKYSFQRTFPGVAGSAQWLERRPETAVDAAGSGPGPLAAVELQ